MADKKTPNLKAKYQAEVAPALMQKFGYKVEGDKKTRICRKCGAEI